jgi:hypothetical protein
MSTLGPDPKVDIFFLDSAIETTAESHLRFFSTLILGKDDHATYGYPIAATSIAPQRERSGQALMPPEPVVLHT